jgi:Acetyltransferases
MAKQAPVTLRDWREDDLAFLMDLRNDVALQAKLLSTARGSDIAAVRTWLARRTAHDGLVFRIVEDDELRAPAGYIQAERVAEDARTWRFGICIADNFQGEGRGPAAIRALETLLSERHGARILSLEVGADNAPAIAAYRRLGFSETARHRNHVLVGDVACDVLAMEKPIGAEGTAR